jgi:HEAT repeat protein
MVNGQESSSNRGSPEWQKAEEAVRHAGVSAVPVLLRMFQSSDQLSGALAVEVFRILDPAAQAAAMPGLIEVYDRSIAGTSHNYEFVIEVWAFCIGPAATNAVPSLLRGVTNAGSSSSLRAQSIMALGRIHAEPELVVPQLIKSLSDSDETVREMAAGYLGDFGVDAKEAVPSLLEMLSDTSSFARSAATNSLKKIDGDAASKASVK